MGFAPTFAPIDKILGRILRQWIGIGRNAPIYFHFESGGLARVLLLRQGDNDLARTLAADRLFIQVAQGDPADDKGRPRGLDGNFFQPLVWVRIRPRPKHKVLRTPAIDLSLTTPSHIPRTFSARQELIARIRHRHKRRAAIRRRHSRDFKAIAHGHLEHLAVLVVQRVFGHQRRQRPIVGDPRFQQAMRHNHPSHPTANRYFHTGPLTITGDQTAPSIAAERKRQAAKALCAERPLAPQDVQPGVVQRVQIQRCVGTHGLLL